jgi:inosine-uridine nucleoside N-ribohydrolase
MRRRNFLILSAGSTLSLPLLNLSASHSSIPQIYKKNIFVDADTANEIDDLYAIVRALLEPDFNILGLSSAQWFHQLSPVNTVDESQKINEDILRLMNRTEVPSPLGSNMIVGKPWGGTEPRDSAAARLMIRTAKEMPDGEKLVIANLGAVTNVASAILLDPDIIPRISVYCISGKFYEDCDIWDKDEFNARRDLNALNVVLNTKGLDVHVMPVNILYDFTFMQSEIMNTLLGKGGIWDYLAARWKSHSPESDTRIFWDLALIEAIAQPDLTLEKEFFTPPENVRRKVNVYTKIDIEKMKDDWWGTVKREM